MKTPTQLTDEQILPLYTNVCQDWTKRYDRPVLFARAIEAAINAQWVEMLSEQEPVAKYLGEGYDGSIVELYDDVKKGANFYTHPQPDDAALLQQALEALKGVDAQDKDRNFLNFDEWCRLDAIIAALKTRLNPKETT